jgi:hypothetical protein
MLIQNPSIGTSDSEAQAIAFRLEMVDSQPDISPTAFISPPVTPNRLYGWYNGASDMVELFMTNSAGNRYVRVATYRD